MPNSLQRADAQHDQSTTFLEFASTWSVALDAGLLAAAEVYEEAVKAKLSMGYTSGLYAGEKRFGQTVAGSVHHRKPQYDRNGVRYVAVGSNDFITRMWEFGHRNKFTGHFERVEHWRNAMNEAGEQMAQSFHDVFDAALNGNVENTEKAA
jgi:hypothetical protein